MPYIDTYAWFDTKLCPQEGETYGLFIERVLPAMKQLQPSEDEEELLRIANRAWANHIMQHASEVTVTITREMRLYSDIYSMEGYWADWEVQEVHSAKVANITYSSLEKSKVRGGDNFKIAKSKEDEQLVFGWANIAKEADGSFPIDWDGDVTSPEDLEKAAYQFVLKYRATGENHEGEVKGQLVESVMFTKEKQSALGIPEGILPEGWWVGFHVEETEVFEKIKSGEYEMFSVQGSAIRQPTGQ